MPKAKECCCGCSLRSGSLILLWITLVVNCISILIYLMVLVYPHSVSYRYEPNTFAICHNLYYFFLSVIASVVSILGIYGMQKNIPNYLDGIFYYYCYDVIHSGVGLLTLIFFPSSYTKFFTFSPIQTSEYSKPPDYVLVLILAIIFGMALCSYFALILKSCRDSLRTRNKDNGFAEIPDPVAVGYHNGA